MVLKLKMKNVCVQIALLVCLSPSYFAEEVLEVDLNNLEDVLKQRKAVMLYLTEDNCAKCRRLYHKFVVTSQTFVDDAVIFARVRDKEIAERLEVVSFPAIIFYEFGSTIPRAYKGDLTSSELSKLVIKALRGDFRSLDLKHAVELTKSNFEMMIKMADQCKLVMLHEDEDEDEIEEFEELAEIFGNDDAVVIARINVDKQKRLKKLYNAVEYPTYYFYSLDNQNKKKMEKDRYSLDKMISLINKECGTFRVKDGRLNPFAGLVKDIDEIIGAHGKDLYEIKNFKGLKRKIKKAASKLSNEVDKNIATFYIDLLDVLVEGGSIEALDAVRNRIYGEMDHAGPLKLDQLYRKRNVVDKIIDTIGKHILNDLSRMHMGFDNMKEMKLDISGNQKVKPRDEL